MKRTPHGRPRELLRLLLLEMQRLALGRDEAMKLSVLLDECTSLTGVDLPLREGACLRLCFVRV